jgi:hypothetical protein
VVAGNVDAAGHGNDLEAAGGNGSSGVDGKGQTPKVIGMSAGVAIGGDEDLSGRGSQPFRAAKVFPKDGIKWGV